GLVDRYVSEVIDQGDLAHTTKEPDLNRINKHISPKWSASLLREVKPYPVQEWLRKLAVAPKTRSQGRQQTHETAAYLDGGRVWGFAERARPSLSLYGFTGWLYRPPCQRGHGYRPGASLTEQTGHIPDTVKRWQARVKQSACHGKRAVLWKRS